MRSRPGRRLTRGARASRRAQVSAHNAEQSAPRRRVHALGARGPGAERAPPPERESATRARPGARGAEATLGSGSRDERGEGRTAGPGQGALQVRRRGTRGGSHVGHLCVSARRDGERAREVQLVRIRLASSLAVLTRVVGRGRQVN